MAKTILIADDEEFVRKTLGFILKSDYELEYAADGAEAFQKALEKDFDLIIMDLKMPGISGIEVTKKIKEKKPNSKIVVLTGYRQEYQQSLQEIAPLILGVLQKPIEMEEFREKIKSLV